MVEDYWPSLETILALGYFEWVKEYYPGVSQKTVLSNFSAVQFSILFLGVCLKIKIFRGYVLVKISVGKKSFITE
jgi:hypothetical protein